MAKELMKKLKKMQSEWKDSEPKHAGAALPDGSYECRIETVILEESRSSGRLQINWGLVVLDGDYEGKTFHKYDGLDDPRSLPYVQGTLETVELDIPEDITDIGECLEEAPGKSVLVLIQTRDEFTNIYFNELLEDTDEDEDEEDEEDEDEEDEDEDEDEEDEEDLTKADVKKMTKKELNETCSENDIKVSAKIRRGDIAGYRKAVTRELF